MRTVDDQKTTSLDFISYFIGGGAAAVTILLTGSVLGGIAVGVTASIVGLVIGLLYISIRG